MIALELSWSETASVRKGIALASELFLLFVLTVSMMILP